MVQRKSSGVGFVQIVGVKFDRSGEYMSKVYFYKAPRPWEINVGDRVIVESPSSGYTAVTVAEVNHNPHTVSIPMPMKWVVDLIDDTEYRARLKKDEADKEIMLKLEERRQRIAAVEDLKSTVQYNSKAWKHLEAALKALR